MYAKQEDCREVVNVALKPVQLSFDFSLQPGQADISVAATSDLDPGRAKGCLIPTCVGRHKAHGYCQKHYNRWRTNPDAAYVAGTIATTALAPRFCERCGTNISDKPKKSMFCSPDCSNKYRAETLVRAICDVHDCDAVVSAKGLCKQHYSADYYAADSEVFSAKQRAWYSENREAVLGQKRDYYKRNKPVIRAKAAVWREENRDLHNARGRSYSARNKDIRRRKQAIYRAQNPGVWREWARHNRDGLIVRKQARRSQKKANRDSVGVSLRDWIRMVNRFNGRCAYCEEPTGSPQMDHVIPLSRGGRHAIGNVLPVCISCNSSKKDKYLFEWKVARPDLFPALNIQHRPLTGRSRVRGRL